MPRRPALLVRLLLLGCLAISWSSSALGQAPQEQPGALLEDEEPAMQRSARRLLFDVTELYEMEKLRAAEDLQQAVLDGRAKPLFSEKSVFAPIKYTKWFGGSDGAIDDSSTAAVLGESPSKQPEAHLWVADKQEAAARSAGSGSGEHSATRVAAQQQAPRQEHTDAGAAPKLGTASGGNQAAAAAGAGGKADAHRAGGAAAGTTLPRPQQLGLAAALRAPLLKVSAPSPVQETGNAVRAPSQQQPGANSGSGGSPAGASVALLPMLLDALSGEEEVPEPELQFRDEGSTRTLIWHPQDTMPRDLLLGEKRPQIWLYTLVTADYEAASLLPHFLEHYMRLGIRPDHMLFVVNHNPMLVGVPAAALDATTSLLGSLGLDYRAWVGQYSQEEALKHRLQVLSRVPIRDWVVLAGLDELHEYPEGATAQQFLGQRDAEGTNWVRGSVVDRVAATGQLPAIDSAPALFKQFPLKCDVACKVAQAQGSKVVAFKGYLRPTAGDDSVVAAAAARTYFGSGGSSASDGASPRSVGMCATEDLFSLTPYHRYRIFYKLPDVQGNSYLWDAREAEWAKAQVHTFRWRAGVERSVADSLKQYREEAKACGMADQAPSGAWEEAQRVMDTIVSRGSIDIQNTYLRCKVAEDPQMPPRRYQQKPAQRAQQGTAQRVEVAALGRLGAGMQ